MKPPRIALVGSRGIPARYGGYETLAEELASRLVARGLTVTVYCRWRPGEPRPATYRGVELVHLPTVRTKHLDTPIHTMLSALHALGRDFDAVLLVNSANALFVPVLQARGRPVALHVDGIEKRRAKWGLLGRSIYALSERLATSVPDRLITDAEVIRRHYLERYHTDSTVIAYGVEPRPLPPAETLAGLGLESRRYFLYVSRFEPENNPHVVAAAYRDVGGSLPLVMVGGAPYARRFIRDFTAGADGRIVFPGPVYGDGYRELLSHALAYVHATEVGGTHPALVEAMGYGNCVVVNDTPENREVAGSSALYFRTREPASLARRLERLRSDPRLARSLGELSADRAASRYAWPAVCDRYESLFRDMAARPASATPTV